MCTHKRLHYCKFNYYSQMMTITKVIKIGMLLLLHILSALGILDRDMTRHTQERKWIGMNEAFRLLKVEFCIIFYI